MPPYEAWKATCDTLHAHTQVLGKLCVAMAPPEPQLQHAALRMSARGWDTLSLPAPDGSGARAERSKISAIAACTASVSGPTPTRRSSGGMSKARPTAAGGTSFSSRSWARSNEGVDVDIQVGQRWTFRDGMLIEFHGYPSYAEAVEAARAAP